MKIVIYHPGRMLVDLSIDELVDLLGRVTKKIEEAKTILSNPHISLQSRDEIDREVEKNTTLQLKYYFAIREGLPVPNSS